MKRRSPWALGLSIAAISACMAAGSRPDLHECEGCEAIHEHRFDHLTWSTAISPPSEPGERLVLPGIYPSRTDPAHIHVTLKEPGRKEYWIDEIVFTDDPLVTDRYRARMQDRGGSGIVTPRRDESGTWIVRRDITLEP